MLCPYCNEEMILGYIQCFDGVVWAPKKYAVGRLLNFRIGTINLAEITTPWGGAAAEAYRCEKCKKIIIDYTDAI